jgi:hypothetical protein
MTRADLGRCGYDYDRTREGLQLPAAIFAPPTASAFSAANPKAPFGLTRAPTFLRVISSDLPSLLSDAIPRRFAYQAFALLPGAGKELRHG